MSMNARWPVSIRVLSSIVWLRSALPFSRILLCVGAAIVGSVLLGKDLAAADIPSEAMVALEGLSRELNCLTVKWRQQKMPLTDVATDAFPRGDKYYRPHTYEVAISGEKLYSEHVFSDIVSGKQITTAMLISFDGEVFYKMRPGEDGNPATLTKRFVQDDIDLASTSAYLENEYLEAAGIYVPTKMQDFLNLGVSSRINHLIRHRGGTVLNVSRLGDGQLDVTIRVRSEVRDNAKKVDLSSLEAQLRSGKNSEDFIRSELSAIKRMQELPEHEVHIFRLDAQLNYAVVRTLVEDSAGNVLREVLCDNFEKVPNRDVWLPKKTTTRYFTAPFQPGVYHNTPLLLEECDRLSLSTECAPDSHFVLNNTDVGGLVQDGTLIENKDSPSETLNYIVPANQEDLDDAIADARELREKAPPSFMSLTRTVLVALNVVLIALLVLFFLNRRWRRSS